MFKEAIKSYTKYINMVEGWIEDKVYACINRADCYRMVKDMNNEFFSLLQSIAFAKTPRPKICSRLGFHYQQKCDYDSAIFWYELATTLEVDSNK